MIDDARELGKDFVLEADVCIVGSGAAGLTLATRLQSVTTSVCLLESGGFELESDTQDLYRGKYDGNVPSIDASYLEKSRLRYFGGTTNHWGGFCRPLDAMDFEIRDWVPHSGWPFPKTTLDPYYDEAEKVLNTGSFRADNPHEDDRDLPTSMEGKHVLSRVMYMRAIRFAKVYRDIVAESNHIRLVHHANVTEVVAGESGASITHLRVRTLTGAEGVARAKVYVLATGGIENCRILLASNSRHSAGLGNEHDQVGRYFMEHIVTQFDMGPMILWPEIPLDLYRWRGFKAQFLFLSDEVLRTKRLLNVYLSIAKNAWGGAAADGTMENALSRASFDLDHADDSAAKYTKTQRQWTEFVCEPEPNPESRVTLTSETDELGMPLARLSWNLVGSEIDTILAFADILGRKIAAERLGRIRRPESAREMLERIGVGYHHMGTTRIHTDPKHGVVDVDCRVHGIDNLYVAGSSVFPTCGAANPTFTLVALAIRLADHLENRTA